ATAGAFTLISVCLVFFFLRSVAHRVLHSFPTRRSSDLAVLGPESEPLVAVAEHDAAEAALRVLQGKIHVARGGVMLEVGYFPLRSEEHTSELQSRENLVCRLLLEKKKATRLHSTC